MPRWIHMLFFLGAYIFLFLGLRAFLNAHSELGIGELLISVGIFIVGRYPYRSAFSFQEQTDQPATLILDAELAITGSAYVLDSEHYDNISLFHSWHPATRIRYLSLQSFRGRPLYGAIFQLIPDKEYTVWVKGFKSDHIVLSAGEKYTIYYSYITSENERDESGEDEDRKE